jgi:Rha family phage regulatory protein
MDESAELKPRVLVVNGLALTTSLAVATHFDKDHRNVMRDIREYIDRQINREFVNKHFLPDSYQNERGKTYESYRLTEQAFALIAFGFTGAKAEAWQIAYVEAFTAMKAHIEAMARKEAAAQNQLLLGSNAALHLELDGMSKRLHEANLEMDGLWEQNANLSLTNDALKEKAQMLSSEKSGMQRKLETLSDKAANLIQEISNLKSEISHLRPNVVQEDSKMVPKLERHRILTLIYCDHRDALQGLKRQGFDPVQDNLKSLMSDESITKLAHCTTNSEAALIWVLLRVAELDGGMIASNKSLLVYMSPFIRHSKTIRDARMRLETRGLIRVMRNKYKLNGPTGYGIVRERLLQILQGFDEEWKQYIKRKTNALSQHLPDSSQPFSLNSMKQRTSGSGSSDAGVDEH